METENSNEEPLLNEQQAKKVIDKDKRASVLKQLDSKKLYPIQERIGIYIIAALSTVGLILIGYTGVMAFTSTNADTTEVPVVAEDVYDMLGELDLEAPAEDGEGLENDDFEPTHEYVEPEDDEPEEEVDPEPEEDEEPEEDVTTPTTATITADLVGLRREPGSEDRMIELYEGNIVDIIDLESNPFWAHVSYNGLEGFVPLEFVEANE